LQVHVLEVTKSEDYDGITATEGPLQGGKEPQISLSALIGIANFRTMRIPGDLNKCRFYILLDSTRKHMFLDIRIGKKFGCKIKEREPLMVTIADGNKITISSVVKKKFLKNTANNFHFGSIFYSSRMLGL